MDGVRYLILGGLIGSVGCTSTQPAKAGREKNDTAAVPACVGPVADDDRTWPVPADRGRRKVPDPAADVVGPCDPLKRYEVPIELEPPVVVGRDRTGTLFVKDRLGLDGDGFIGRNGVLTRVPEGGVRQSDREFIWGGFGNEDESVIFRIDRGAWHDGHLGLRHLAMARFGASERDREALRNPPAQSMCDGELLEILPPETIVGWTVAKVPWVTGAEYAVEAPNGNVFVVTRSGDGFDHLRVFYGPRSAVKQRGLLTFAREKDGGSTTIRFMVDGKTAEARFPWGCNRSPERRLGGPCPGKITLEDEDEVVEIPLENMRARGAGLPDATYLCGTHTLRVTHREANRAAQAVLGEHRICMGEVEGDPGAQRYALVCRRGWNDAEATLVHVDAQTGGATVVGPVPVPTDAPRPRRVSGGGPRPAGPARVRPAGR